MRGPSALRVGLRNKPEIEQLGGKLPIDFLQHLDNLKQPLLLGDLVEAWPLGSTSIAMQPIAVVLVQGAIPAAALAHAVAAPAHCWVMAKC